MFKPFIRTSLKPAAAALETPKKFFYSQLLVNNNLSRQRKPKNSKSMIHIKKCPMVKNHISPSVSCFSSVEMKIKCEFCNLCTVHTQFQMNLGERILLIFSFGRFDVV